MYGLYILYLTFTWCGQVDASLVLSGKSSRGTPPKSSQNMLNFATANSK